MIIMVDEYQIFQNTCGRLADPQMYQMLLVVKWERELGKFYISKHGKENYVAATNEILEKHFAYANRVVIFEPYDTGRRRKYPFNPSHLQGRMTTNMAGGSHSNCRRRFMTRANGLDGCWLRPDGIPTPRGLR